MKNSTILILSCLCVNSAQAAPLTFNVDGVISDSSDVPVEASSVAFTLEIKNPLETCTIYRENFTVNMTGSKGYFSLVLGNGTNLVTGGVTLEKAFSNQGTAIPGDSSCSYTPASTSATRKIVISFDDGSGPQTFSTQEIQSVPYALEAVQSSKVGTYSAADLFKAASTVNQTTYPNSALTQGQYDGLWKLILGDGSGLTNVTAVSATTATSATSFTGALVGDVTGTQGATVVGKIKTIPVDTTGIADGKILKYQSGSFLVADDNVGTTGVTSVTSANSYLSVATGTTTPALTVNVGTAANTVAAGNDSRIVNALQNTLTSAKIYVGNASGVAMPVSVTGDISVSNAGVTSLAAIKGKTVDATAASTMGQIMYFDSAADKWKVSASTAPSDGQVLKWNNTTKVWEPGTDAGGWTAVDSSYAAKGIVQFNTDAATSGITVASGVATVLRTTSGTSNQILSLDGTGVANMYGLGLKGATSGLVTIQVPNFSNYILTLPSSAGINNQVLSTDGTGVLSWTTPSSTDATKLPLAGGTLTGTLITDNITMAANKYFGLSSNATPGTTAGQMWYDGGVIKYFDGTVVKSLGVAGAGITSVNGLSGASQTLSVGTTGADFAINSSGSTHTFNLPSASASNRGALTSADWSTFNSKQGTTLNDGKVWIGNASNSSEAQSITGDATLANNGLLTLKSVGTPGTYGSATLVPIITTDAQGRVTGVTSAAPLDSTKLPLAGGIVTGNITMDNQTGTLYREGTGGGTNYAKIQAPATLAADYTLTLPADAGTAGQVLSTNGVGGVLSWVNTLTNSLTSGKILIGNSSNLSEAFSVAGDATLSNTGVLTIGNSVITDAKVAAGIDAAKIGGGAVSNTEYSYLDGVTSAIQTQFTGKVAKAGDVMTGDLTMDNQAGTAYRELTSNGTNTVTVKAPANITTNFSLILPADDGNANQVLTTDGLGALSWTTPSTTDATKLPLAGGTMGGSISMGGYDLTTVGQITMAAGKYLKLSTTATDGTAAGQMWYDSSGGVIKYYDGTTAKTLGVAGAGITSLNGLTGATQTLQVGTTGSDFNISSSSTTHTFNLPSASASNRGALTSADWSTFNAKQSASLPDTKIWVGNASGVAMPVLMGGDASISNLGAVTLASVGTASTYGSASLIPVITTDAKGRVTNVSTVAPVDSTKVSLNGDILFGDITMSNQTGTVYREQGVNGANTATIRAPDAINANYTLYLPGDDGTANQFLQTDGSGNLTWATPTATLPTLNSALFWVGSGSNTAIAVSMGGDATMNNTGIVTLGNSVVTDAKVATGIAATKIGGGAVDNTEYSYLDGVTSAIQTQFTGKVAKAGDTITGDVIMDNAKGIFFRETTGNGTNSAKIVAPTSLTGDYTLTLPVDDGTTNQVLTTDGFGVLSWTTPSSTDATKLPLAGGTMSGAIAMGTNNITGINIASTKQLQLNGSTSGTVTIVPAAAAGTYTLTLPSTAGSNGQVMASNGSGTMSWITPLANSLTSGKVWVGNGSNIAAEMTPTTSGASNTLVATDGSGVVNAYGFGVKGATSGTTTIQAPALAGTYSVTLPSSAPSAGQVMQTADGSGNMTWVTPPAALGYTPVNKAGDTMTGALTVTGNVQASTGQVYANQNIVASGATVNFDTGNVQIIQSPGSATLTLNNMKDGGSYTLIITDTTSRQYTFSNCTNAKFVPANDLTTAGTQSIYTITKVTISSATYCYISWVTGF